jgi:hypothetical protein
VTGLSPDADRGRRRRRPVGRAVKLSDLIDKRRARELVDHYARQAGIRNVDEAAVLKAAEAHFRGLLAEWRRHASPKRLSARL